METILDKIVARKMEEIAVAKEKRSIEDLKAMPHFVRTCSDFKVSLLDSKKTGIIAEFKRKSPSKGVINALSSVEDIVKGYTSGGASAISVLTDTHFFGGSSVDLLEARKHTDLPLLRKDFTIEAYQIYEAKAWGADIILLIAAILNPSEIASLTQLAQTLGMFVLLEVHNAEELERNLDSKADAIGVNNRSLADFTVNISHSFELVNKIPPGILKISESAISEVNTIRMLRDAGFNGFLIGENFMKSADPVDAFHRFAIGL